MTAEVDFLPVEQTQRVPGSAGCGLWARAVFGLLHGQAGTSQPNRRNQAQKNTGLCAKSRCRPLGSCSTAET